MEKINVIKKRIQPDLHYIILKECVSDSITKKADLLIKYGISEYDNAYSVLEKLEFIKIESSNVIVLLPQGFSTYLTISSQKQSSEQARKSIKFATWALAISIAWFITSIIFNIITFMK